MSQKAESDNTWQTVISASSCSKYLRRLNWSGQKIKLLVTVDREHWPSLTSRLRPQMYQLFSMVGPHWCNLLKSGAQSPGAGCWARGAPLCSITHLLLSPTALHWCAKHSTTSVTGYLNFGRIKLNLSLNHKFDPVLRFALSWAWSWKTKWIKENDMYVL